MTDRQANKTISDWIKGMPTEYVISDRCAVELLVELTRRNRYVELRSFPEPLLGDVPQDARYRCVIMSASGSWAALGSSVARAITGALLQMIESEEAAA